MILIPRLKQEDYANQGSTIGTPHVPPYASFYCRVHDFGHAYVNPYAHISPVFFKFLKNNLVFIILYCLKTYCYIFDF